jgi:hypothetical protein
MTVSAFVLPLAGIINDMDSTISSIVAASDLPLSVLILGVGSADFSQMETLDGDKHRLSIGGRTAQRDIVQFVPMRDFFRSGARGVPVLADISKALLAEIPGQLLEYMKQHSVLPNPRPTPAAAYGSLSGSVVMPPPPTGYV